MRELHFPLDLINHYVLSKQHLSALSRGDDLVQVCQDICALHATVPLTPYLSLWSRTRGFTRDRLEQEMYEKRSLTRLLCMRSTLHIVPSRHLPVFYQATNSRLKRAFPEQTGRLLLQGGLCREGEEARTLDLLGRRIQEALRRNGSATVSEISTLVPELNTKISYAPDRPYAGEFSLGSRIVPGMCTMGLLVRTRPRGSWRSNLYEYSSLDTWLPDVDLDSVSPHTARTSLIRWYLAAFGPATVGDAQWWSGFTMRETRSAIKAIASEVVEVTIHSLGDQYLMMADDARKLQDFALHDDPSPLLLPSLDPYIMGYRDRQRFLETEHYEKVFDRAGNAVPTVWAHGAVVGAWGQRKDGSVAYGLFGPLQGEDRDDVEREIERLETFFGGESVPPRSHTTFTRSLGCP